MLFKKIFLKFPTETTKDTISSLGFPPLSVTGTFVGWLSVDAVDRWPNAYSPMASRLAELRCVQRKALR